MFSYVQCNMKGSICRIIRMRGKSSIAQEREGERERERERERKDPTGKASRYDKETKS